jgi:Flp pilus assembly protein TadG
VEFVLVLPIFLILLFGIIDFGLGLRAYITLTNATREGARVGAVGEVAGTYPVDCNADASDDTTVVARVCTTLAGLDIDNIQSVGVDYPDGFQTGNSIEVSAEYRYDFVSPLAAIINGISGGTIDDSLTLSSTADMRLE